MMFYEDGRSKRETSCFMQKIKRVVACALCAVMVSFQIPVMAEELPDSIRIQYDTAQRRISYEGYLKNAYQDPVYFILAPADMDKEQIDFNHDDVYVYQDIIDQEAFSGEIKLADSVSGGAYTVYVSNRALETNGRILVINTGLLQESIPALNRLNQADLAAFLTRQLVSEIGFDGEFFESLKNEFASYLYRCRPAGGYEVNDFTNTYLCAEAILKLGSEPVQRVLEENAMYLGIDYQKDYNSLEAEVKAEVDNLLKRMKIDGVTSFSDYYQETVLLAKLKKANSMEALKKLILVEYQKIGGMDLSEYNRLLSYNKELVFSKLYAKQDSFTTLDGIKKYFDSIVREIRGTENKGNNTGSGSDSKRTDPAVMGMVGGTTPAPQNVETSDFSDMAGHWAYDAVKQMCKQGVINGYSDQTFRPQNPVTRAEFAVMVFRFLKLSGNNEAVFQDVPESAWYFQEIGAASRAGIIAGYAGAFEPEAPITRQDGAVIIGRTAAYLGKKIGGVYAFADSAEISEYAAEQVGALAASGILEGSGGYFKPMELITRAETAVLFQRIEAMEEGADTPPQPETESQAPSEEQKQAYIMEEASALVNLLAREPLFSEGTVTRGAFLSAVLKLGKTELQESGAVIFSDVKADHPYAKEIDTAYQLGMLSDSENFRPDDSVTQEEAMRLVLDYLRYGELAEQMGGYPAGYRYYAYNMGLMEGITGLGTEGLSSSGACLLLFNMLHCHRLDILSLGDEIYKDSGKSILRESYDIYDGEGVVTGTPLNSLTEEEIAEGLIAIDSKTYEYENSSPEMLGKGYQYYYQEKEGVRTIVLLIEKQNRELVIEGQADLAVEGNYLRYDLEGKTKRAVLNKGYFVLYNGRRIEAGKDFVIPDFAQVALYDNDEDGRYDVLSIMEYSYLLVRNVDKEEDVISDAKDSSNQLDLSGPDCRYFVYDSVGKPSSIYRIAQGELLRIAKSRDGGLVRIYRDGKMIEGTINGYKDETVRIDGTEYYVSDYFKKHFSNMLKIGTASSFWVAGQFLVAADENNSFGYQYGYLVRAWISEENDKLQLRIFTQEGSMREFAVSDKLRADGKSAYGSGHNAQSFYESLFAEGVFQDGLVRFSENSGGEITSIDFPRQNASTAPGQFDSADNKLTEYRFNASEFLYKSNTAACAPYFNMGTATVFHIPSELSNKEAFQISGSGAFYNDQKLNASEVSVYDLDEKLNAGAVVYHYAANSKYIGADAASVMIESVEQAVNEEDETGYTIELWEKGIYKKYFLPAGVAVDKTAPVYQNRKDGSVLCRGDIVRYTLSADGEIDRLIVDFDAHPEVFAPNNAPDSVSFNGTNSSPMYQSGRAYSGDNSFLTMTNVKNGGVYDYRLENLRLYSVSTNNAVLFDMQTKTTKAISCSEINTYLSSGGGADYVVIRQNNYAPQAVFVYRNSEG